MYGEDPERDHRIDYEVIVDAYGDEEVNMGWYYYFAETLQFPFDAVVKLPLRGSKTEEKKVKIVEVEKKEDKRIRLGITEGSSQRLQFISPENIVSVKTSDENLEVLNDWLYWNRLPLL